MSSRDYYCCYSCEREKAKTTLLSSCKKTREKMNKLGGNFMEPGIDSNIPTSQD